MTDVRIPKNAEGRARGFGFVQFDLRETAEEVVRVSESLTICGRPVAVDFAVAKSKYVEMQKEQQSGAGAGAGDAQVPDTSEVTAALTGPPPTADRSDDDSSSDDDDDSDSSSDEDSSSSSDEESGDDMPALQTSTEEKDVVGDGGDDGEASDDTSDGSSDSSDDESGDTASDDGQGDDEPRGADVAKPPPRRTGVGLDHTVFCRNVSFATDETTLRQAFSRFGKIRSVKVVVDPHTQRPRGTAFVNFVGYESVAAAIEAGKAVDSFHASKVLEESSVVSAAVQQGGIVVDGRRLLVTAAISRAEVSKMKAEQPKEAESDKRNLYLAAEGVIREGDAAAAFLTASELALRANAERIKSQKLRDPNHFVSLTRLCVRNLPLACDDRQLKEVFLQACDSNPDRPRRVGKRITSVFIVRDKVSGRTVGGVPRSMGYGFVNFQEHDDALFALRALNNRQTTFDERAPGPLSALAADADGKDQDDTESTARSTRRLIVEFAVENAKALAALERRKERKAAARAANGEGLAADSAANSSSTPDEDAEGADVKPRKRKRKPRLSSKNRPNAAKRAREAESSAAAAAVTAEAAVSKRRARANEQTGDDLLASSMDGDGRGGEKKKQRRDRRGKRGKQEKSRREEGSLQSMIENYSKDKIFPLANSPHACCGVCRNEVLLMMR